MNKTTKQHNTALGGSSLLSSVFVVLGILITLLSAARPVFAQSEVVNTASASYETQIGTDSAVSDTVTTTLVFPDVYINKTLVGPVVAQVGDEVTYTLDYGNNSPDGPARNVTLRDSLPAGLEYVSSDPVAEVQGQILSWDLGDVAPGANGRIELVVRISYAGLDSLQLKNTAILNAENSSSTATSIAGSVAVDNLSNANLSLEKAADVLEIGLGEAAPFTLTMENTGSVPLRDLVIHDSLPEGTNYVPESATGADSVTADGRALTFYYSGPLAPTESRLFRYTIAILSSDSRSLRNEAYATAGGGLIRTSDAVALVRVRETAPMETRAAIGKVWVDRDGDGVQDFDEPGIEGVDIWTDDGSIATTDSDGRYSFRNVRPGRHGFRLDPSTIPVSYGLDGYRSEDDLIVFDASGWTTPVVDFRLVPRVASIASIQMPLGFEEADSVAADTVPAIVLPELAVACSAIEDSATPTTEANNNTAIERAPLVLRGVNFHTSRYFLLPEAVVILEQVAEALREYPGRVRITGHTDSTGTRAFNAQLAVDRANSVAEFLIARGIDADRLETAGFGPDRPIATNITPAGRWQNRRVELEVIDDTPAEEAPVAAEPAEATNCSAPVTGIETITESGSLVSPASLITTPAGAGYGMSARGPVGGTTASGFAVLTASAVATVEFDAIPEASAVPAGAAIRLQLDPSEASWPEVIMLLPDGWAIKTGTSTLDGDSIRDPALVRDRDGKPALLWELSNRERAAITIELSPLGSTPDLEPVSLTALRTADERAAEHRRAFVAGPAVEFFAPVDGTVEAGDRIFVGVRGEASAPVSLFDGDSLIAQANLRVDGVHDFIAVQLARGTHTLRVSMQNSWGQTRWDSATVHVVGAPAAFVTDVATINMIADGHSVVPVRFRVVDQWGVPAINRPYITVAAEGAEPTNIDEDRSSVGIQVTPDAAGWVEIMLRPGREVVSGRLTLSNGDHSDEVALRIHPAIRPLMISAVGRVGIGASPEAFGSIAARGRLDARTSVVMRYDSRNLEAGRDAFNRSMDPLEEAQYPILGDAAERRVVGANSNAFQARVERGFDWVAVGDIATTDFGSELTLSGYHRSVSGAAARITTGDLTWQAFGSSTNQRVGQTQFRGEGISGPYNLPADIRIGTERIVLETRAAENAQRIVARQIMTRFVDYQVDYERGVILFKRPVPGNDNYGNPVFVTVTFETERGGTSSALWGVRTTAEGGRLSSLGLPLDSIRLGATWIREGRLEGDYNLAGADLRLLQSDRINITSEISYAQSADSAGLAAAIEGQIRPIDGLSLTARWRKTGSEFHNPANIGILGGTEEIAFGGSVDIGTGEFRIRHERQRFETQGVDRHVTSGGLVYPLRSNLSFEAGVSATGFDNGASTTSSQTSDLKLSWKALPTLNLWTEARRQLSNDGQVIGSNPAVTQQGSGRPNHIGFGADVRVAPGLTVEGRHHRVFMPGTQENYGVTNIGLRSQLGSGTEAWGSYEVAGIDGTHNAAVVGLNNRIRLGSDWTINGMIERRQGVSNANTADPIRALPFLQQEEDYLSVALGVELLPQDSPYRGSLRGEFRDGDLRSTRLLGFAGDLSVNRSLAVLTRQEFLSVEQTLSSGNRNSRKLSSLLGLAFRPINSDRLNVLAKFELLDEVNPNGSGVLASQGEEARMILAAEAIWSPTSSAEFGARYAVRRTSASLIHDDGLHQDLTSFADFIGWRAEIGIGDHLGLRAEGRVLMERTSNAQRYDIAPQLLVMPLQALEIAAGYRFGNLTDPDFAVRGGQGAFLTVGVRLTERSFASAADFWRDRVR